MRSSEESPWLQVKLFDLIHEFILKSWFPTSWILMSSAISVFLLKKYLGYYIASTERPVTRSCSQVKMMFIVIWNITITYTLYLFIEEFHKHYVMSESSLDERIVPPLFTVKPMMHAPVDTSSFASLIKHLELDSIRLTFLDWFALALINVYIGKLLRMYPELTSSFLASLFFMMLKWGFSTISFSLLQTIRKESTQENYKFNSSISYREFDILVIAVLLVISIAVFSLVSKLSNQYNKYTRDIMGTKPIKMINVLPHIIIAFIAVFSLCILALDPHNNTFCTFLENSMIYGKLMAILMFNRFAFFSVYHGVYDMASWFNQKFLSLKLQPKFLCIDVPIFTPLADDITTTFIFHILRYNI